MPWPTCPAVCRTITEAIDLDLETGVLIASLCDLAPGSLSYGAIKRIAGLETHAVEVAHDDAVRAN